MSIFDDPPPTRPLGELEGDDFKAVARSGLVRGVVTADDAEMMYEAGLDLGLRPLQALAWQRLLRREPYPVVTSSGHEMSARCSDAATVAQ